MAVEQAGLARAWYGGAWWLWLLRPVEWLFRSVAALRRQLYRAGWLSTYRPDKPVVVVGNISVGGTGKTPVVIALVEALQQQGIRVGVVSRGYGASVGAFPHRVNDHSSAADCGDEPLLIYRRTHCPLVVAPSRPVAVRALLAAEPVDVIISDDGLQHYALARDLEVAVVDAQRGSGNGFCLPAGPLREPVSRLATVDYVLFRGSTDPDTGVRYECDCLVNVVSGEQRPALPASIGEKVFGVAGIGQPGQFFASLSALGFALEPVVFEDHHAYRAGDFSKMHDKPIIMTEKDAVKCRQFIGENAWYLRINAHLPQALHGAVATLARANKA